MVTKRNKNWNKRPTIKVLPVCMTFYHHQALKSNIICNNIIFKANKILGYLSYLSLVMFRWLFRGSSNKFQGIEVFIDPFPIERFEISPQWLEISSLNGDNTNKIFWETFLHHKVEIWNIRYLQTATDNWQPTVQVSHGRNQLPPFLEHSVIVLTSQVD